MVGSMLSLKNNSVSKVLKKSSKCVLQLGLLNVSRYYVCLGMTFKIVIFSLKNEIARLQFHKIVKLYCMIKNISSVIGNISTR